MFFLTRITNYGKIIELGFDASHNICISQTIQQASAVSYIYLSTLFGDVRKLHSDCRSWCFPAGMHHWLYIAFTSYLCSALNCLTINPISTFVKELHFFSPVVFHVVLAMPHNLEALASGKLLILNMETNHKVNTSRSKFHGSLIHSSLKFRGNPRNMACFILDLDDNCYQFNGSTSWEDLWSANSLPILPLKLANDLHDRCPRFDPLHWFIDGIHEAHNYESLQALHVPENRDESNSR